MKKIIKEVDKERGIVQVTTADERWYVIDSESKITGLPEYKYIPSVTWISGHYPKGIAFYKWLADKGWDEAEAIKSAAGDKGSKVHKAIEWWLKGNEVRIDSKFQNPTTEQVEELTLDEYNCVKSFTDWWIENKPELLKTEIVVVSEKYGYAGTLDLIVKINGEVWIVDIKTGQSVWPEYELQLSAYKQAAWVEESLFEEKPKLAILQIGYKRNKNNYKWNEIEDKFPLFLAARQIWANENDGTIPAQKDYPIVLPMFPKAGELGEPKETKPVEKPKRSDRKQVR